MNDLCYEPFTNDFVTIQNYAGYFMSFILLIFGQYITIVKNLWRKSGAKEETIAARFKKEYSWRCWVAYDIDNIRV